MASHGSLDQQRNDRLRADNAGQLKHGWEIQSHYRQLDSHQRHHEQRGLRPSRSHVSLDRHRNDRLGRESETTFQERWEIQPSHGQLDRY